MLKTESIRTMANADFEFTNAARFWDAVVVIDMGAPERYILEVKNGRIERFEKEGSDDSHYNLRIAATRESWIEFLKPTPRPFFHDLFAAMTREGFSIEGSVHGWGPYYPALRRFFEIVRSAS